METIKLIPDGIKTIHEKKFAAQELKKAIQDEIQLSKNGEGYNDPTAYQAIKNIEKREVSIKLKSGRFPWGATKAEKKEEEKKQKQPLKDDERFYKTLHSLFHVLELGGFDLEGRITLVDKRTGKVWR